MNDPCLMTAEALGQAFAARHLSPVEVTQAVLARIARHGARLNAFTRVDEEGALSQAHAAETRYVAAAPLSPIDGVPTTIKGLNFVRGWPCERGSKLIDPTPVTEDAPVTARLREAGAVLIGHTTSPEFGWKGLCDSPLTGITRNPWNIAHSSGGSSGGAAVAAACGFGTLHQGSDGAGSIRIPAAFTGIFGIKGNFGRVPVYPASAYRTVSHVGPMTRTVRDSALMLNVIQRPDPRDPTALPYDGRDFLVGIDAGVRGLRLGYSPRLGRHKVHPDIAARVDAAVKTLAALGAIVEQVDPEMPDPAQAELVIWSSATAKLHGTLPQHRLGELDPGFRAMAEIGKRWTMSDWYDADAVRMALGRALELYFRRFDALITPTMPIPALKAGQDLDDPTTEKTWLDWSPFSYPFNITGHPAASIPCSFTTAGLPVGLQIVGRLYDEAKVLRIARGFEHAMPPIFPKLD